MTLTYNNTKVQIDATFTLNDTAQNPSGGVTFEYRQGHDGQVQSATATNIGTGIYRAEVTPDEAKDIFYKFKATGDIVATIEGHKRIERGFFWDDAGTSDYDG